LPHRKAQMERLQRSAHVLERSRRDQQPEHGPTDGIHISAGSFQGTRSLFGNRCRNLSDNAQDGSRYSTSAYSEFANELFHIHLNSFLSKRNPNAIQKSVITSPLSS
ncbi:hypothetical protein, partial [Pseudomonas aeruginosa]